MTVFGAAYPTWAATRTEAAALNGELNHRRLV